MRYITIILLSFSLLFASSYKDGIKEAKRGHYAEAYEIWSPVDMQSDRDVQYYLGYMFARGYGVEKSQQNSIRWYRASASQGHVLSALRLGLHYSSASNFDKHEASTWLKIAAKGGITQAQFLYGKLLYRNFNDTDEATLWLQKAASKGSQDALKLLKEIGSKVPVEQIVQQRPTPKPAPKPIVASATLTQPAPKQKPKQSADNCLLLKERYVKEIALLKDKIELLKTIEYAAPSSNTDNKYFTSRVVKKNISDDTVRLVVTFNNSRLKQMEVGLLDERYNGKLLQWSKSGRLILQASFEDGKLQGELKRFFLNGVLKSATIYKNNLPTGVAKVWYKNRQVKQKTTYKDGLKNGKQEQWYSDGTLATRASYKDGGLHDKVEIWYKDGTIKAELNYRFNTLDGVQKYYSNDGELSSSKEYNCGKVKE